MSFLNDFFIMHTDSTTLIMGEYNYPLVALSIILASAASFFALHFAAIAEKIVVNTYKTVALVSGAFIMATGIWSMHFVGMMAFDMGHGVNYDPFLTLLSILPSVFASYITLKRLIRKHLTLWQQITNGILVGLGIGTMHYIGMEAMEMKVSLKYDPFWFTASILTAVVLAFIALSTHYYVSRLCKHLNLLWCNSISALIMGLAIAGMHYMGMAGARFVVTHDTRLYHMHNVDGGLEQSSSFLITVVSVITIMLFLLAATIASQLRYRQLLIEKSCSEVRLKTTLDTAVDGVVTVDSKGQVTEYNKAAANIFGWQEAEILYQPFDKLFTDADNQAFKASMKLYFDTGESTMAGTEREACAVHKSGRIFPVRIAIGRVEVLGTETLFVGFITDISERRSLEETLIKREKQYSSLIKNIPGASFRCLINEHWNTVFVSEAIQSLAGWCVSEFYDDSISLADLIHPEDDERISQHISHVIKERKSYTIEYRLKHKNGHYVWVLENGTVVYNEDNQPEWIDGVILDISQRVEMEEELRKAKVIAEASAETKASFLANMSHEIRTPMNAIIGFSDILLDSDVPNESKKHLATISKSARSLLHLLNDILDSAKLEKNKLELEERVFSLETLVDSVISTLWLQAKSKGLELSFSIQPMMANVYLGAEDRIRQVLMNLIGNAIKFTEKGSITLTVSRLPNNHIRFVVEDTGIGIPTDRLDSVFDPFIQADASMSRRFGGTGLGTSISKQLVNLMGGDISVSSQEDVGSCFSFSLPLKESSLLPDDHTSQELSLTPKRILLADDLEQNLTLLSLLLGKQGHEIVLAKDGHEAIKQFKTMQPDIILMDIQMPNMDGLTATQIIRSYEKEHQLTRTPVIALTANVLTEDKLDAQRAGMDGFANKPIEMANLISEMARVLDESPIVVQKNMLAPHQGTSHRNHQIHASKGLTLWGDADIYLEELNYFANSNQDLISKLHGYIEERAFTSIRLLAHGVKGTSGNLALIPIANEMLHIEQAAQKEDAALCLKCLNILSDLLTAFNEELQTLKEQRVTDTTDQVESQAATLSQPELLTLLDTLIDIASFGELDDDNSELLIQNIPKHLKCQAIDASNAMADFDFNNAVELLNQLKTTITQEGTQ
ncbi:MHYT domain-containing protein [Marinomonas algarum]|uniref:histidine kinase n=1 Tax=Marinomonas algarum TaxID=2883105 RepID=A0A9X1IKK7_9GAMM|nr:MHYT domain-containing protein [Marinomonas algarum]MCB5160972.1 PAS domain S-box protein [Marinomonas algarum]